MKKILLIVLLLALWKPLVAQKWTCNFEEAKKTALSEQKKILLVFAGSDWCTPCLKLERYIFETTEFQHYASEEYVLLKADFPRKKANKLSKEQQKHNEGLAEIYNKEGHFPLVLILDSNGTMLGKTGYKNISPKEYIQLLESQND